MLSGSRVVVLISVFYIYAWTIHAWNSVHNVGFVLHFSFIFNLCIDQFVVVIDVVYPQMYLIFESPLHFLQNGPHMWKTEHFDFCTLSAMCWVECSNNQMFQIIIQFKKLFWSLTIVFWNLLRLICVMLYLMLFIMDILCDSGQLDKKFKILLELVD